MRIFDSSEFIKFVLYYLSLCRGDGPVAITIPLTLNHWISSLQSRQCGHVIAHAPFHVVDRLVAEFLFRR